MNERIKELSKQAFMLAHEVNDTYEQDEGEELSETEFNNVFNEKFADLIIKECRVALSPMLRDMISRGQAYDLIKQHFGVKE